MLRIELSNSAKRFLKRCDRNLYERLMKKIKSLSSEPFPSDVKRVIGKKYRAFRVRVGEYRITYTVFYNQNLILIADIDKRSRAYN